MADKDLGDGDGPSLELPSLGSLFKRKKKPATKDDSPTVTREELEAVVRGETSSTEAATEPTNDTVTETDADSPAEAAEPDDEPTVVVPVEDTEPDVEPTTVLPPLDDEVEPVEGATDGTADAEATADAAAAAEADVEVDDIGAAEEERPLFVDEVDDAGETPPRADLDDTDAAVDDQADDDTDIDPGDEGGSADEDDAPVRFRNGFTLPVLPGRAAAAITGLIVGVLAVAMTYLAVQGCEKVKGTSSCGTPGFFLLIAIMILLVVLGSSLLNAWQVADAGSTSFMAVGLLAVVALLFLIKVIYSPWMALVIPLVAVATYVVSHWLTSLFVEEDSPLEDA